MSDVTCSADGCESSVYRDISPHCAAHRIRRYKQPAQCMVEGCSKPAKQKRVCMMHLYRMRRTGTYDLIPKPRKTVLRHSAGYVILGDLMHPLAVRGFVYEHRKVLFDLIGPGPHACHYCAELVDWHSGLEVDHIDYDRGNNAPSNLVPSCHGCNSRRARHRNQFSKP